ncbi:MAG TPA: hypothetical protein VF544_18200 [Pyrinomonadaceae bacterium]|jgi:hypothetical protein
MGWCADPYLTYLKSFGYNVIRLPKADLKPLQLMAKQGKELNKLGDLTTLLVAGENIAVPKIEADTVAANISGQRTGEVSIGIGLSILGNIIGAMGGSKLGLETSYKQAKSAAFEFTGVLEDKIELIELDQYLADADVNPFSRYVADMLEADELYVTTATIKSTKFTIEAKKSDGTSLEVEVPVIQGIVGSNVKVANEQSTTTKVSYEGNIPLVFGFQAIRLFYEKGQYKRFKPLEPGFGMRSLEKVPDNDSEWLTTESPFVDMQGFNV